MRENISKVAERGERLDSLQDKTGAYFARHWCLVFGRSNHTLPSDPSPFNRILGASDGPTILFQTISRFLHKDSVVGRIEFARYVSCNYVPIRVGC
jgi:hypothetical protein